MLPRKPHGISLALLVGLTQSLSSQECLCIGLHKKAAFLWHMCRAVDDPSLCWNGNECYQVAIPSHPGRAKLVEASPHFDAATFADERLQPRGGCHETEIFEAFRRSNARYRTEEALSNATLRQFIRNWAKQYMYPTAERTSTGYFKKISLREKIDPFTGKQSGVAAKSTAGNG